MDTKRCDGASTYVASVSWGRRAATLAVGASQFGIIPKARLIEYARRRQRRRGECATGTSFGPVKQIDAGVLDVGYVEAVRLTVPVMLMHGFPYDIHSSSRWRRCWRPPGTGDRAYFRGHGATTFRSPKTPRMLIRQCSSRHPRADGWLEDREGILGA